VLQRYIPGQIGRFDDSFNLNCIEILFAMGVYLLFEAGHFEGDYQREITRKYIFIALKFITLNENDIVSNGIGKYLNIPQNKVAFYDFYIKMSN
jgi:hypothetical protein